MIKLRGDILTLKQFLQFPELKPPLEFFGGRVVQKMSPNRPHSVLQIFLGANLLQFATSQKLGLVYTELRCTFSGESYVPDLSSSFADFEGVHRVKKLSASLPVLGKLSGSQT
jgi:Uma2 family endonuclease